jgi:hypothetical protein
MTMLDEWVTKLSARIGIDPADVDVDEVLDLARDAAHGIARPAAPLSAFLVGYAAGLQGGGRAIVAEKIRTALAAIAEEDAAQEDAAQEVAAPDAAAQGAAAQEAAALDAARRAETAPGPVADPSAGGS